MDGVSAAASIYSLIEAAEAICDYGLATYKAKAEQRKLSSAIDDLKVKLKLLKQQDERAIANPVDPWFQGVRAILASSKQFTDDGKVEPDLTKEGAGVLGRLETAMQNREDKLSRRQIGCTALPRRLLWYWERKKFEETIAEIHQWTQVVDTVCNYDHFTLSLDTHAQVKMGNDDMKIIKNQLGKAAQEKEKKTMEKRRVAIVTWLSPLKFRERQSALLIQMSTSLSAPRLLTSKEYQLWEEGHPYILHCEGKPGAGKTLLSAVIVKHLQGVFEHRDVPILCMYLNYKEQGNQSLDNLISSLLKQMIQREGAAFRSTRAKNLYEGVENEGRPTLDDFFEALCEEIVYYERVIVIVDALDEATTKVAPRLVQRLQGLPKEKTSILMTSQRIESERRVNLWDQCNICGRTPLKVYFECNVCHSGRFYVCNECKEENRHCEDETHHLVERAKIMMNVEPTPDDIRSYVQAELKEELELGSVDGGDGYATMFETTPLGRLIRSSPNLQYEITDIVVAKSDGMYALAGLYMKSFRSLGLSEAQILEMLDHPPEEYSFFYEQHMQRILLGFGDSDHRAANLGKRILSWVACTKRPLSLSELQDALAVDLEKPGFFSSLDKYDRATIIRATAGLVTIDNPSELVRLNHQSAQEYFDQNRERWFPNISAEITRTALHYLSLNQLSEPCEGEYEDKEFEERKGNFPFLVYAYQYWGDHAADVGSDPTARAGVIKFLSDSNTVASTTQAGWYLKSDTAADWDIRKGTNGLHISAWFGLSYTVTSLLGQGVDIDFRDPHGQTPLMYACRRGQTTAVAMLLTHGADVNESSYRGNTPMFEAVSANSLGVVELLLERPEIDVNMPHGMRSKQSALMVAIQANYFQIAIPLLDHLKLDITRKDINGNTALSHAIISRHSALATRILDKHGHNVRLIDSTNWIGDSALFLAAKDGQEAIVKHLLSKGADLSITDKEGGGTALLRAVDGGHISTVELLLGHADMQSVDEKGRGLLHGAAISGQDDMVHLLLAKGLNPNSVDKNGATPLHDGSRNDEWAVARTLIDAGADASLKDNAGRTPWTVAWQNGYLSVMRVLEGKEQYERTPQELLGQYPNAALLPVWSLAYNGEKDLVAQAIRNRAHEIVHINPDNDNTALHSAILSEQPDDGQTEIMKMLLQAGMAADARNQYSRTPLHLAAQRGSVPIIKLLLEEGNTTVDMKDKWGTTPLLIAYADENKYIECALLLIEAGAIIPATKQTMKQSLFFSAIEAGSMTAVVNLVQMGADVQVKNVLGYTGLQLAKDAGKVDIERYLRKNKSVKVPGMGRERSEEEEGEEEDGDEGERMGALALMESPFHRPKAWLEAEEDEKREDEKGKVDGLAIGKIAVEKAMALQQLTGLDAPTHIDALRDGSTPEKGNFKIGAKEVRVPQLAY